MSVASGRLLTRARSRQASTEHDGTHKSYSVCAQYAPQLVEQLVARLTP